MACCMANAAFMDTRRNFFGIDFSFLIYYIFQLVSVFVGKPLHAPQISNHFKCIFGVDHKLAGSGYDLPRESGYDFGHLA